MPKRLERAIDDGKMVVRAYTQKELDLMEWLWEQKDYTNPNFTKYFTWDNSSRGIIIYPRTNHFVSYDNEHDWCAGWEKMTGLDYNDFLLSKETDLIKTNVLKNAGTKDIDFLEVPAELDPRNIIWIAGTNLREPEYNLKYNVWLFNLTKDAEHYAVVTDIGNCWWHWDGTIVAKKDVIILKEDE